MSTRESQREWKRKNLEHVLAYKRIWTRKKRHPDVDPNIIPPTSYLNNFNKRPIPIVIRQQNDYLEQINKYELWKHLLKKNCVGCDKKIDNTAMEYRVRGNYCQKCNEEASTPTEEGRRIARLLDGRSLENQDT